MSRFNLVTLGLAIALVALVAIAPLAANAAKVSRPLTLIVWKGSLINLYLNLTDAQNDLGLAGGQRYYFKFALGISQPTQELPVLIHYKSYYCAIGFVPVDLTGTISALWMTTSLPYYQQVNGNILYFTRNETNPADLNLWIYNVGANKWYKTNVIVRVKFTSQLELKEALQAAYGNNIPEACQQLLDLCANGCTVDVLGLIVPPDANIATNTQYSIYYWVTAQPGIYRTMAIGVKTMEPSTYLVSFWPENANSRILAFGRTNERAKAAHKISAQEITVYTPEGPETYYVNGYVNVTINWTKLQNDIKDVYGSELVAADHNVSVLLAVVYKPSPMNPGETIAASGLHYEGTTAYNYTEPNSLLTNATENAASGLAKFIEDVYGRPLGFGTYEHDKYYLSFYLAVNPAVPLPIVNKLYDVRYEGFEAYLPAAYGSAVLVVRLNETIVWTEQVGSTTVTHIVKLSDLNASLAAVPAPFLADIVNLPLGYDLAFVPSALLKALNPGAYGDSDVMNAYDQVSVTVYNMFSNMTKFYIAEGLYKLEGAENPTTLDRNVTALEARVILARRCKVMSTATANGTALKLPIGAILARISFNGTLHITYTLRPAPYGGAFYYLVPAFAANLTNGEKMVNYAFLTMPPVNYTNVNDVVLGARAAAFRIRPVAFAWPLVYTGTANLESNKNVNTITYQGYLVVMGVGYNITDLYAKGYVKIGNITLPFSSVAPKSGVSILAYKVLGMTEQAVDVNSTAGIFAFVVPLWTLSMKGYSLFATPATSGYITITVAGSGEDYDVNASLPGAGTQFNTKYSYTVSENGPYVLVDPVPVLEKTETPYYGIPQVDYNAYVVAHLTWDSAAVKTPGAAYTKLSEFGVKPPAGSTEYNYTHVEIVVYGKAATGGDVYYIEMNSTSNAAIGAIVVEVPREELAEGYYYTGGMGVLVPSLPADTYEVALYNVSAAATAGKKAYVEIVPSAVFHSERLGYAALSIHKEPYAEIMALPNDTIDIYGYGWQTGLDIQGIVDQVQKFTIPADQIASDGSWYTTYQVPAYKVGSTITLELTQTPYTVGCYIRVLEIKRNALVVKASTAPAIYDDGTVKLPVVITVTYYDVPVSCKDAHVTLTILGENVPEQLAGQTIEVTSCKEPGIWYTTLNLGEVKSPETLILVAKAEIDMKGVKLVQFATTAATVDPQIKMYAYSAANNAAEAYNEIKSVASKLDNVISQLNSISSTLNAMSGKVDQILSKLGMLDEIATSITNAKAEIEAAITKAAAQINSRLDQLTAAVNAIKTSISTLPDTVTAAIKKALANVPTKDDVKSIVEEAASMAESSLAKKIDALSSKLDTMKSDLENMISGITDSVKEAVAGELGKLSEQLSAIKTSVENLKSDIATLKKSVSDLSGMISDVKTAISDLKTAIQSASSKLSSEIGSVKNSVNNVANAVSQVQQKVESLTGKIDNVSTNTMVFGAATLVVSIIVLALLILVAVKSGLLASH